MTGKELIKQYNQGVRDFRGARLQNADLQDADLQDADLQGAYLQNADLRGAYLQYANLQYANLQDADLQYANLQYANLQDADLRGAYLRDAYLRDTNLANTILDPAAQLPVITDEEITAAGFIVDGDWVTAWRTAKSQRRGSTEYKPGEHYQAPYFSVDSGTDCHPGLYVAGKEWLAKNHPNVPIVEVKFNKYVLLHAGDKWRVREFWVVK